MNFNFNTLEHSTYFVDPKRRTRNSRKKKKFSDAEMTSTIQNIVAKLSTNQRPDSEIAKKI